ncbi:MAG: tetratricopeptide repeat protein [Chitinophagales bacterium]|nr:tetratricopeptide repeat protein [Chitinophagales bacterium]
MNENQDIAKIQEKIDDLNEEAWRVRLTDSEQTFKLAEESVRLSREIGYTKGLANGCLSLGFAQLRISKNKEALALLTESLSLFEKLNEIKGQADCYEYLASIRRNFGELELSLSLSFKALTFARQIGYMEKQAGNNYQLGVTYKRLGNFEKALEHLYESLEIIKDIDNELYRSYPTNMIGTIHLENEEYEKALGYFKEGQLIRHKFNDKWGEAGSLDNIGYCYLKLKRFDEAIQYFDKSLAVNQSINDTRGHSNVLLHLAELYYEKGDEQNAIEYAGQSLELRKSIGDIRGVAEILLFLGEVETRISGNDNEKTLANFYEGLKIAEEINAIDLISRIRKQLYQYYKDKGDFQEALKQFESYNELEKVLNKNALTQKIVSLEITNKAEEAKREMMATQLKNEELNKLNKEINEQKTKIEETLTQLKATQSQLIQSEKMASLGELTAGIAHEIQNPLNFVNNFSDLSNELIQEMKQELQKGNTGEAIAIADDLGQNLEKILHHGKRADGIIKGMLQHSRSGSGQREPTDINVLCDEYLKLAYHGFRAKDKSFNAKFETAFGENVPKLNLVPQEIGRVVLNLINNAFYAVNERQKAERLTQNAEGYEPTVIVSTKKEDGKVIISVKDNGNGIPASVKEKVFQPFFTTKPTGEGTGLGLSLSYDIVKAHGGELKVETKEGGGTVFFILLPAHQH